MPIRLGDGWRQRGWIGNWRLPGEPAFADSRAFQLLFRDLERYLHDEIAGRSFLIAGHRGAGKTATVTQALREIRSDVLVDSASAPVLGRRGRIQRPLTVKLVGEGLIAPLPQLPMAERKPSDKDKADAAAGKKVEDKPAKPAEGPPPTPVDQKKVESALVHITIGLYRALAAEVNEAFAVHALEGPLRERSDRLELAAQLALELDGTPEPGALRDYWDRLGRLREGVLWPPDSDAALERAGFSNQGYREVVAVATAAQAFQVCSGAVSYTETSQDSATNDSKLETGFDAKDLVTRLGPLVAGAFAGGAVGAQQGPLTGVGSGLLVLLASAVTLRWSGSRQRRSERKLDYTFLRDRSIQTLDRDLPLVIERIRAAGLAPVFVIDELDKLDDQAGTITAIIKRLKHLVSDYGFFCFLTNRDYFDEIEQKVAKEAYPTEHTYFGERVLILNRPQDVFDYIFGLIDSVDAVESGHFLRSSVFALAVMFRAKLHFSDLSREIDRLVQRDNSLIVSDQDLQAPGRLRLEATIQLAINEVLSSDEVMERFRSDPGFAQLAIDALYYIPRSWQNNSDAVVEITEPALRDALIERRTRRAAVDAAADGKQTAKVRSGKTQSRARTASQARATHDAFERSPISPPDLRELLQMVRRLVAYLEDLTTLKAALAARSADRLRARPVEREWPDIVVDVKKRLLQPLSPGKANTRYRFVLDELAREIAPPKPETVSKPGPGPARMAGARAGRTSPPKTPSARTGSPAVGATVSGPTIIMAAPVSPELLEAVSGLITVARLSIGDLVANRLLPATVSDNAFNATLSDIRLALQDPRQVDAALRAADGELAFRHAFDGYGDNLARALVLLGYAWMETGALETPGVILSRIGRYLGPDSAIQLPDHRLANMEWVRMKGTPQSIGAFRDAYYKWREKLKIPKLEVSNSVLSRQWEKWREQVIDFVRRGRALHSAEVDYLDIVLAAQNAAPGRLFRSSLLEMDQADWSRAALAALPKDDGTIEAPYWLLFAALLALGFDAGTLARMAAGPRPTRLPDPSLDDLGHIDEIIRLGTPRPAGILHVYPDGVGTIPPREIPASKPMLSIGESAYQPYMSSLDWLVANQLFDEGRDEIN